MKKAILVTCDNNYSTVLSNAIVSIQKYATKIKADLHICYGGYPYFDRYQKLMDISDNYTHAAYIDCDCFLSSNAPDIFESGVYNVAYKPVEKQNKYRQEICSFALDLFGIDFDPDYYCFGGLSVGPLPMVKELSRKVIALSNNTKGKGLNKFLSNDEIYLAQVLKSDYPDFNRLDIRWMINSGLALSGHEFYIAHPFLRKEDKVKELQKLTAKFGNHE